MNGAHRFDETTTLSSGFIRRVSWGAIFAGTIVALSMQLLLSLLGIAIGAASFDRSPTGLIGEFGTGTVVWLLASTFVALFAGGCVAGRLSGAPPGADSALHGVVTWGLATLMAVFLFTTAAGALIAGATGQMGQSVVAAFNRPGDLIEEPAGAAAEPADPAAEGNSDAAADLAAISAPEIGRAALWAFLLAALGAIAAAAGGLVSGPRPVIFYHEEPAV